MCFPYNVLIFCKQSACLETPGAEHGNPAASRPRDLIFFPCGSAGRVLLQCGRRRFDPWVGKIPWRRERLPTPVFWPGEFHGLYSPRGPKQLDTTEWLSWQILTTQYSTILFAHVLNTSLISIFLLSSKTQKILHLRFWSTKDSQNYLMSKA